MSVCTAEVTASAAIPPVLAPTDVVVTVEPHGGIGEPQLKVVVVVVLA
jgi:hypothetical protein